MRCFERLLNRIQITIRKTYHSNAIIFCDEGHSNLTKLRRKMGAHNPIPSDKKISEIWLDTIKSTKNIIINNIVEDIIYKVSKHCMFNALCAVSKAPRSSSLRIISSNINGVTSDIGLFPIQGKISLSNR